MASKYSNYQTITSWNNVAQAYQNKFMDLDIYDSSYNLLISHLHQDQTKVLELGCGPGNMTRHLASRLPQLNILATDASPKMIELATESNINARFQCLDCRDVSTLDESFDMIVMGFVLPYLTVEEVEYLLDDCVHLMNDSGLLYMSFVSDLFGESGYKTGSTGESMFFNYHNRSVLQSMFSTAGFDHIESLDVPYVQDQSIEQHTIWILRKLE